jgi:nucleotide-binding universal stress UspA family protein
MSNPIKKIMVPVDFSDTSKTAVTEAQAMAGYFKAEIHLLHVVDPREYYVLAPHDELLVIPPVTDIEKSATKKLKQLKADIKAESGIDPRDVVLSGDVHHSIVDYAREKNIDLIVMGTHGASGFQEMFMGSNAQKVVTLSEKPVLTLHERKTDFAHMLLPFDNSPHSREKVNIAIAIAGAYKSTVHILGLTDTDDQEEMKKFKLKLKTVEERVSAEKLPFRTTVEYGDSLAGTALEYAKKNKCDIIVINTGHESKITGIFLGAFAQQIVNHSTVPVLSVRHKDNFIYEVDAPGFGI